MKRRPFNFACAILLLMIVGLIIMWGRSYWRADNFIFQNVNPDRDHYEFDFWVVTRRGEVGILWAWSRSRRPIERAFPRQRFVWKPTDARLISYGTAADIPVQSFLEVLGFRYYDYGRDRYSYGRSIAVPYWVPVAISALLPALWLRRRRQLHRAGAKGLCAKYGYDLRASTVRCPECASPIQRAEDQRAIRRSRTRIAFDVLTALSFALFLLTIAACVASITPADWIAYRVARIPPDWPKSYSQGSLFGGTMPRVRCRTYEASVYHGKVLLGVRRDELLAPELPGWTISEWYSDMENSPRREDYHGLHIDSTGVLHDAGYPGWCVSLPFWCAAMVTGALPGLWLIRRRRWKRLISPTVPPDPAL